MRERSHKKGEVFQQDAKHWLIKSGFLGFEAEPFGDAYDVTKKACTIGGVAFDFSLKLRRGEVTRRILYGERKFRGEQKGSVGGEFREFLRRVYRALAAAGPDDADHAVFVSLSNIPPGGWRDYLRDRQGFCEAETVWGMGQASRSVLVKLVQGVHLLALSASIIARD